MDKLILRDIDHPLIETGGVGRGVSKEGHAFLMPFRLLKNDIKRRLPWVALEVQGQR